MVPLLQQPAVLAGSISPCCSSLLAEPAPSTPLCRDTRALLASGNEADAQAFIADNPHKRLWQLLADHALGKLDLAVAEKAFVHCNDYQGVQLIKHLAQLGDKIKQQAEVGQCGSGRSWW